MKIPRDTEASCGMGEEEEEKELELEEDKKDSGVTGGFSDF